jgi:hypothetical protein
MYLVGEIVLRDISLYRVTPQRYSGNEMNPPILPYFHFFSKKFYTTEIKKIELFLASFKKLPL